MKQYHAKTLIDGYKLGIDYAGKTLVAVPLNKAIEGVLITYKNRFMPLRGEPLKTITFQDKFGRGSYTLCYYEWVNSDVSELWRCS